MNELKPCPFCGNEADLIEDEVFSIQCRTEGCFLNLYIEDYGPIFTFDHLELLVEAWNTREDEILPSLRQARRLIQLS
jgi:hypothetical protein